MKKSFTLLVLALGLFSASASANAISQKQQAGVHANNIVDNYSFISFGYKHSVFSTGAMAPYFDNLYSNEEQKALAGLFVNLNAQLTDNLFLDVGGDFVTRFSSSIDQWHLGAGYVAMRQSDLSVPIACGAINYSSESDHSDNHSELGAYCRAGVKKQMAKHWLADVSYQHQFLSTAKDSLNIDNVFQFGRVFGLVVGGEFAKREKTEVSWKIGVRFSFS